MSGPIAELIAQLSAEDPFCPEIPEAALRWSESEVRVWFASDGRVQPASSSPRRGEHPEPVRAFWNNTAKLKIPHPGSVVGQIAIMVGPGCTSCESS